MFWQELSRVELGEKALSFFPTHSLRNRQGSQAALRNFMSLLPGSDPMALQEDPHAAC